MTKEDKKRMKKLLKEWGTYTASIYLKNKEMDMLSNARLSLESRNDNVILLNSIEDRVSTINRNVINRLGVKREMDSIIDKLPYDEQSVIRCRYVDKTPWEVMPVRMPFYVSLRQCYRLHERALEFIFQMLEQQEDCSPISG